MEGYFAIIPEKQWTSEFQELIEEFMQRSSTHGAVPEENLPASEERASVFSERFQSQALTTVEWMLHLDQPMESTAALSDRVMSIAVPILLPPSGEIMPCALQSDKDLRFRLMATMATGSENRTEYLLDHIRRHLPQWLERSMEATSHNLVPHKQGGLASILQFLRTQLVPSAKKNNQELASELLETLLEFVLHSETQCASGATEERFEMKDAPFLSEMTKLLRCLTENTSPSKQEGSPFLEAHLQKTPLQQEMCL